MERDSRSPGGNGFTGLQALLGYAFNQALAINTFGPEGHILAVDAFVSTMCSNYATPATIAMAIKQYGSQYRQCYSWLGPNQPGVNETDPSDPTAAVPDPGGAPPGESGPLTAAARLNAASVTADSASRASSNQSTTTTSGSPTTLASAPPTSSSTTSTTATTTTSSSSASGGGGTPTTPSAPVPPPQPPDAQSSRPDWRPSHNRDLAHELDGRHRFDGSTSSSGAGQASQLLNYLLAP